MAPCLPCHDEPYVSVTYVKLFRKRSERLAAKLVHTAYAPDFFFCQDGVAAINSTRRHAPPLGCHVANIVCLASKEEMGRVAAGRVIAAVQDEETVGDLTVRKLPCHPVRLAAATDAAVSKAASATLPFPAFVTVSDINSVPERSALRRHIANRLEISSPAKLHVVCEAKTARSQSALTSREVAHVTMLTTSHAIGKVEVCHLDFN